MEPGMIQEPVMPNRRSGLAPTNLQFINTEFPIALV